MKRVNSMTEITSTKDALSVLKKFAKSGKVTVEEMQDMKWLASQAGEDVHMECRREEELANIYSVLENNDLKKAFLRGAKRTLGANKNRNSTASMNMLPFVEREYRALTL